MEYSNASIVFHPFNFKWVCSFWLLLIADQRVVDPAQNLAMKRKKIFYLLVYLDANSSFVFAKKHRWKLIKLYCHNFL